MIRLKPKFDDDPRHLQFIISSAEFRKKGKTCSVPKGQFDRHPPSNWQASNFGETWSIKFKKEKDKGGKDPPGIFIVPVVDSAEKGCLFRFPDLVTSSFAREHPHRFTQMGLPWFHSSGPRTEKNAFFPQSSSVNWNFATNRVGTSSNNESPIFFSCWAVGLCP